MKRVYVLLLIFCILNIVDYSVTLLALSQGVAIEGNPIASYFIDHNVLHYFKLIGVSLLCIYLIHAAKRDLKSHSRVIKVLRWANLAYGFIAVSNVVVYFMQEHYFALK